MSNTNYEIEIRFRVTQVEEAYDLLPFLAANLGQERPWYTEIIGRPIYEEGRLLRVAKVPSDDGTRAFIGYKGPDLGSDMGTIANIRYELGEEMTRGLTNSAIMQEIGIAGDFATADDVFQALTDAGHQPFMAFAGVDRLGVYEPLNLQLKAMTCPKILGDDVLIELEFGAASVSAARTEAIKLEQIVDEYGVRDRLFRDEPPTMLFNATF